jgi:hypothetical protein
MSEIDLLQQARESLQQGERDAARKQLADLLLKDPENEKAWMLMARVVETPKQKKDCYERAIKINPNNIEAKKELVRMEFPGHTYDPKRGIVAETPKEMAGRFRFFTGAAFVMMAVLVALISSTLVYAKNNPDSQIAQMLPSLPSLDGLKKFNPLQYDSPEDALIAFAKDAANGGMDGAPAQPDYGVTPSLSVGEETFAMLGKSAPQAGDSSTITIDEYHATSAAALVLQQSPNLPARDVQVYLRNGQILIWCIVDGDTNSTSALAVATIAVDANGTPSLNIISAQVGRQSAPMVAVTKMQTEINQAIIDQINAQARGMRVTNIYIDGGVLTATAIR